MNILNIFSEIYKNYFYQPLLKVIIFLYQNLPIHDLGVTIILATIFLKIILAPFTFLSFKYQKNLASLQPKIKEIKKNYPYDKKKQNEKLLTLYKEQKINPLFFFLITIIQLPIFLAGFQIFLRISQPSENNPLYASQTYSPLFLNFFDLSRPSFFLALLVSLCQFFQIKVSLKKTSNKEEKNQFTKIFQKQMLYFFTIFIFLFLLASPSSIGVFLLTLNLLSLLEQFLLKKYA